MTKEYGLMRNFGGTDMDKIVETLELMCDKENPQDKKLLLLAELVETRCGVLSKNQEGLKKSLDRTNEKLDKLTELLEKYERDIDECPVFQNREDFEKFSFFIKNPRILLFIIVGIFSLLVGVFSSNITDMIKFILGV